MDYLILSIILGSLLILNQFVIIFFSLIDYTKKRKITYYPNVSFIMSTYNDSENIEKSIDSIYTSYQKDKIELFIINDHSTDNTLEVLKKIKKKYKFKLINNESNLGKAKSINKVAPFIKGELIFILDSDALLNKDAMEDIIARFNSNPRLAAVSSAYSDNSRKFLQKMQNIEYSMIALLQGCGNIYSSVGLFGGCVAIKRDAFLEAGMITINAINDDTDLGLKLNKLGYKVEQSFNQILVNSHVKIKKWFCQKMRWGSGLAQCFLRYFKIYITNPISLFLIISTLLTIILTIFLINNNIIILREFFANIIYPLNPSLREFISIIKEYPLFWGTIIGFLIFPLLFTHYILFNIKNGSQKYSDLILIYPFVLIYLPILIIIHIISAFIGIYKFFTLKKDDVGWRIG